MRRQPVKVRNQQEAFSVLAEQLRAAQQRPTIYGYKAMDHQINFHKSNARGRLFIGGNRSGKTVGGATEMIMWLMGQNQYRPTPRPPIRARAVGVDFLNGIEKIVRPEIARWMPPSALLGGSWENAYDKEQRTLHLENGSFLEFMSYDQDLEKFAGTSRHAVWFDEEPPHAIFVENRMRLLDTGGSWWITMTPIDGMTWVYDDVYLAARTDPNLYVEEVSVDSNVHINPGEIDMILTGLTEDEKEARRHGKFVQIGGLIYKQFNDTHIIPPLVGTDRWEMVRKDWLHVCAMDHGLNNPTAWLWAAISKDGKIIIYDEHYERGKVVSYHAKKVLLKNRELQVLPSYNVGDPSIRNSDPITGTSVQLEYVDHGVSIVLGNNDVHGGIARVAGLLETHNIYVTANCENLIRELARYRWSTWATKKQQDDKNVKEEPHKKDDHAVDALRYLIASRPQIEDIRAASPAGSQGYPTALPSDGSRWADQLVNSVSQNGSLDYTLGEEW